MGDITLLSETPISLSEVKSIIDSNKKEKKELNFRENKVIEYTNLFCKIKPKESTQIKEEISSLNIARLKERHIIKIIDTLPEDVETLKSVFAGEELTLKPEDLNKIIEITKKYA